MSTIRIRLSEILTEEEQASLYERIDASFSVLEEVDGTIIELDDQCGKTAADVKQALREARWTVIEEDLDNQLKRMRFGAVDEVTTYLNSLRIDTRQFSRNEDGQLLSVHGTVLTEVDQETGRTKFSERGVNATAGWVEDLNW